ncbi:hypothetical protein BDY17DRAFT_253061 [Neohortaea acidophila]|uniref:Uncharacterized protein n=1 Tax=Neohortaea acidophila TaxID=245834 RepID=A0A6A6PNX1_9PEZI|nr:uncharacterized protein BDY17DRAFT_253061 [Neohortaea acidophila]KAF2481810.1 hypothetical protein BDY17DRAFT_253061 [Neohortaea acidophila]
MVFCTYCGQSFTRDEHLERHILTLDTNVKPFKCFTCHMSFGRDLLQRHYTVHGKDQNQYIIPTANGMIPKSAGRTPIACSNCAKTKTKCDKKFPCSRCAGRNLRCTLRPTRRATKGGARADAAPEEEVVISIEPGAAAQQLDNGPRPQPRPPPLKPATPRNVATTVQEDRPLAPLPIVENNPGQFVESVHIATPSSMQTPGNGFIPTPVYEDFVRPTSNSSDATSSPNFMLDWTQIPMTMGGFDGVVQPQMLMHHSPESAFDAPTMLSLAPAVSLPADGMLTIMPNLANGPFRHLSTHSMPSMHSDSSSTSDASGEMTAIIAARDCWSSFQCNRTLVPVACPKTARLNLERLEQTLKNHHGWGTWTPRETDFAGPDHLIVMQLHESSRDKLLAITQSFLHKALEIHGEGQRSHPPASGLMTPDGASNFVLMPPTRVLEYFLRSYANCFERYYPLTGMGTLDANELLHCYNDRAASLLVLMMIAQGATVEARMLTGGLTEAARISLFDLIEKNIAMASDPLVLHAALLFTVQAAWSGDKWQMDIAKGQRNMYFSMLRHSGALAAYHNVPLAPVEQFTRHQLWKEWITAEKCSRLVYCSVMIDQEMALFNDMPPLISVTECTAPMPDAEQLWLAKSDGEWSTTFERVHEFVGGSSVGSGVRPPSLRELFTRFLDDDILARGVEMTPLQLRLLLSPLQALVTQLSQLLSCFPDSGTAASSPTAAAGISARERMREVQVLLGRWFALAEHHVNKHDALCPTMQTNLIIFHLISLNAVTDFPEIERLARGESCDITSLPQLFRAHKRCVADVEEAVYHCGQVLRMVRMMPRAIRPPWWAAAVYRAALVLWADALVRSGGSPSASPRHDGAGPAFPIDNLPADHALIVRYLQKREGVPCVTRADGSQMGIDHPYTILLHCIDVLDEGAATRFSEGVRGKLEKLASG